MSTFIYSLWSQDETWQVAAKILILIKEDKRRHGQSTQLHISGYNSHPEALG